LAPARRSIATRGRPSRAPTISDEHRVVRTDERSPGSILRAARRRRLVRSPFVERFDPALRALEQGDELGGGELPEA